MASSQASQKLGSELFIKSYDHDPGATTAVLLGPDGGTTIRSLDIGLYRTFGVMAKPSIVGGGGLTKLEIVASVDTAFTSVTVIKDSGTVAADSLDDVVFLETSAEEVGAMGAAASLALRYVAARLTHATNTDESVVTYIAIPRFPRLDLTATLIT